MGKKNKRFEPEAGVEDEDDAVLNTEMKKKKQRKEKKQVVGKPSNGDENESEQVVQNASDEGGKKKKRKQKKEKEQADEDASDGNGSVKDQSENIYNWDGNEVIEGFDVVLNTEMKKKKQKKEKKQEVENPSNGDEKESEQVGQNASDEDGKKKKKKKKKKQKKEKARADENASNGNGSVKDEVENSYNWDGNEVIEGFEATTDRKTVVVRGMALKTQKKKILDHFRGCGFITQINVSTFSNDGKISALAFVEFEREDAAKSALALDGTKLGEKSSLKIELSRICPKKKCPPAKVNGCKSAYIGNLPRVVDEDDIRRFFKESKIESVELALYKTGKNRCRGFGHIFFTDDESLENAMKKDSMKFNDRPIKVAYPVQKYTVPSKKKGKLPSA